MRNRMLKIIESETRTLILVIFAKKCTTILNPKMPEKQDILVHTLEFAVKLRTRNESRHV